MLAATLSLTNCAKEAVFQPNNKEGIPFELVVSSPVTKTTIDGFNVSWNGGVDAVSVYHAEAGSTTYVNDGSFSVTAADAAAGRFTGSLASALESGKTYDWYVLYPYTSAKTSPAVLNAGYVTIGCTKAEGAQTQNGNNSTAHLAGSAFPLYGVTTGVAYDSSPSVTMKHLASYVEFEITNNSSKALTVSKIQFDAPQNIIGTYYVNFADPSDVKYSASGNSYVANSVTLNVSNGAAIPVGQSAKFYIGIKPMDITASAGSPKEIKVTVNGYEKTITLTQNASFVAGKVKNIKFNYDSLIDIYTWDLTTNSYSAASDDQVTWSADNVATMVADKYNSSTKPNNYLPTAQTSTRFYKSSKLTFTPASGMEITKIEAEATTDGYTTALQGSTWTNANATSNGRKVTITPVDGSSAFYGVISATTGLNWVKVYYREYVARTLLGIEVTTAPTKLNYTVGETLDMTGAVITANYDNSTSENVTASVTTDGAEVLAHAGNAKPVTVSYQGKTATFNVNVAKASAGLSYDTASYTVAPNASFNTPVLSNPHNLTVTYSSSDESLVLVDENTGEIVIGSQVGGPVTITAATAGNDDYNAGEASYTITISTSITYYRKVTEAPADWAGTYLIVCENNSVALTGSGANAGDIKAKTDVTISDGKITASSAMDAISVTIATNANSGYTIKTASNLYIYNTSSTSNGFVVNANVATADDYTVTLGIDSNGNAVITSAGSYLRYNSSSNIFNYYKASSYTGQKSIQLYKRD